MQTSVKTFTDVEPIIIQQGNFLLRHFRTKENPTPFRLEGDLRSKYKLICAYFSHDESFLQAGKNYSFSKDLMLCGGVGTGKTLMMQIFSMIMRDSKNSPMFDLTDSHSIVREFLISGFETIEKYSSKNYFRNGKPRGLCIDDMGMEDQNAVSYGNKANVIEQILYERYKRKRTDGMRTHATTNCAPADLGKLYGTRVADRMMETFNVIEINGKSLRK